MNAKPGVFKYQILKVEGEVETLLYESPLTVLTEADTARIEWGPGADPISMRLTQRRPLLRIGKLFAIYPGRRTRIYIGGRKLGR